MDRDQLRGSSRALTDRLASHLLLLDALIDLSSTLHEESEYDRAVKAEKWLRALSLKKSLSSEEYNVLFKEFPELGKFRTSVP